MADLLKRSATLCLQIGEARRLAARALDQSSDADRALLKQLKKSIDKAYIDAEGYDFLKAKHEYEDKHELGTPPNQHLRKREAAFLQLVRECSDETSIDRDYESAMLARG